MLKSDKERVVAELVERLRRAQTLLVADYRGLTMPEIDDLRGRLLEHGVRFSVVKNTLTKRAAEVAGVEPLLELLDGPTAIAFLDEDADPVAAAKVLNEVARTTKILAIRGGIMEGRPIGEDEVRRLATLPPMEVLQGQVLAAIIAPLNSLMGLLTAPLQNLHGLIDARIEQLGGWEEPETGSEVSPGETQTEVTVKEDDTSASEADASGAAREEE